MRVSGYRAHLTLNELSIESGKNLALFIMSHSIVVINSGFGDSAIVVDMMLRSYVHYYYYYWR